ncbi:MAG: proprotein convertase P-domain-containing protein, partial [Anaerolineae bacterium]|nr:proprotein convertase P-domain-containing protein [Anaerolineae bacterium]
DVKARAAVDSQLIGPAGFLLTGAISDNHSGGAVEVCRETDLRTVCDAATSLVTTQSPTSTASVYDDAPAAPIAINSTPFCGGGEITRTFIVADGFIVGDVDLGFNGTHPYREDIVVELVSPAGTHARVIAPSGIAYGFENYDVWLNDAVSQSLHDNTDDDPAEPYYDRAARPYEPLSVFNGEPANGVWELRICDLNPAQGDGTYNRARLSLTPQGTALSTAGTWSYPLPIIAGADGLTQNLAIYAADGVGNRTTGAISLTYLLDVVPPVLTVTGVSYQMQRLSPSPVLTGTVSDGGGLDDVYVRVEPPDGASYYDLVGRSGADWSYTPRLTEDGAHTFWLAAYDQAGNTTQMGPYTVLVGASNRMYLPLVLRNFTVLASCRVCLPLVIRDFTSALSLRSRPGCR